MSGPDPILITGAAGFLGSHLTFRALERGWRVFALARATAGLSAQERLKRLRHYFSYEGTWPPAKLTVLEGDIEDPWLGLGEADARELFDRLHQVIHCAARLDFSPSERAAVLASNTAALGNFLPLLTASKTTFNLMSTAYVCGAEDGRFSETLQPRNGVRFRNHYEESKSLAERMVHGEWSGLEVSWRILRPSIVVGEHRTGKTLSFNTIYAFLQLADWLQANTSRDQDLELRIRCSSDGGLNLVPVDYVTDATLQIVSRCDTEGRIFHLTNPSTVDNLQLGTMLSDLFPALQMKAADEAEFTRRPPNRHEKLIDRGMKLYQDYLGSRPEFDDRNTGCALQASGIDCPEVDRPFLTRLVDYGRRARWGRGDPKSDDKGGGLDCCQEFFDSFLPGWAGRDLLADAPRLDATFEVLLTDIPSFRRVVEIRRGQIVRVALTGASTQWTYELSSEAFERIAAARLDPRQAFFSRRADIRGDLEAALRFATLLIDFFRRHPFARSEDVVAPR